MSHWVVIPDYLEQDIQRAIDDALRGRPCAASERQQIRGVLIKHFDEHGVIPQLTLAPTQETLRRAERDARTGELGGED